MYDTDNITLITEAEATELYSLLTDDEHPGALMPRGLFLWQENGKWVACDNDEGFAWTDEFTSRWKAEKWLLGEEDVEVPYSGGVTYPEDFDLEGDSLERIGLLEYRLSKALAWIRENVQSEEDLRAAYNSIGMTDAEIEENIY